MYNSVYCINNDNWSICVLLPCSLVPEYFELGLSSISTAAGVLILDWLNSQNFNCDFGIEQLFFQQLVEFFSVHQINHFPVACCECNLPHNLLGQWFIWWMVLLIQYSNSKYLRVWVNYCYHRRSNLKSECISCMPNWNRYKFIHRKIEIKIIIIVIIIIIIIIINRPSASNTATSLQHCISTDNHNYLIWAPLHSTCTCVGIHCTPVKWLTFSTFCMITSYSILIINKY